MALQPRDDPFCRLISRLLFLPTGAFPGPPHRLLQFARPSQAAQN